ncbi:MAG: histidine kinase [Bacteroidales bacterium]|nr:histidine kinase [Bacteroidales bacterium]
MLIPLALCGQHFTCYDKLDAADGLSQSTVNCILQDRDGLIWFGTQDGLNVYDGIQFYQYQNIPSDPNSLSNNYILSLCEDSLGNIWAGTMSGGLNCLDKKTGQFQVFLHDPEDNTGISNNNIWALAVDNCNNIFAGTSKGLNIYSIDAKKFIVLNHQKDNPFSIPSDFVVSVHIDAIGEIWVGTSNGLAQYINNNKTFKRISGSDETGKGIIVWSIRESYKGVILMATNNGLFTYDDETGIITQLPNNYSIGQYTFWSAMPLNDGLILSGTREGIRFYNVESGKFEKSCMGFDQDRFEVNSNVWCFLPDRSGFIWAGTDEGLLKISTEEKPFQTINAEENSHPKLSEKSVNSILEDQEGNLWVGTEGGGLNLLKRGDAYFTVYKSGDGTKNKIAGDYIWSLLEDSDNNIWIGTYGEGISVLNKETGIIKHFQHETLANDWLSNSRILAMLEDKNGDIWIGTRGGGLNRYLKDTGKFEVYMNNPEDSESIASNTVLSLAEDADGFIWVGTFEGGLCKMDLTKKTFQTWANLPNDPASLSNNNVWVIWFDSRNRMWLGTQGGLNLVENTHNRMMFSHINKNHGLPSNVIFGLAEDSRGNIWMSTFNGIAMLNDSILKQIDDLSGYSHDPFIPLFTNFDESFGLQGKEFNQGAHFQSANGTIYFGGAGGYNKFHPDSIRLQDFDPPVIISEFKIFNREVEVFIDRNSNEPSEEQIIKRNDRYYLPKKISYINKLTLTYRERVFSFSFASLDYTQPKKNNFAYIMQGFEDQWNHVGNRNMATYTNLSPGKYMFRVRGTNSSGIWSKNEASLEITILPPFWKTIWFIVAVVIFIILTTILVVRRIIINQKKKAVEEMDKMELQLKTIKNQIDPHFAFNAMNMIGSLVYKGDPDIVYDYFTRFAQLMRSTLKDSEKISRSIREELEFVENYLAIQKTRFKEKFEYSIKVSPEVDQEIQIPKMIVQTHVENAIKHGLMNKKTKGHLEISIEQSIDKLYFNIVDDGIGREEAAKQNTPGTKKGLSITDKIFSLYKKLFDYDISQEIVDLKDIDGKALGTKILITIDLGKK